MASPPLRRVKVDPLLVVMVSPRLPIGIGRTHVIVLVQDLNVRIIDAATGELLRELVLDTSQRHQPLPRTETSA